MTCPACGAEVADLQKFCHGCGTALGQTEPDDGVPEPALLPPAEPTATEPVAVGAAFDPPEVPLATEPVDVPATEPVVIPETEPVDVLATEPVDVSATEPVDVLATEPVLISATEPVDVMTATTEFGLVYDEASAPLFDGRDEFAAFPTPREPFQVRLSLVLAIFGAAAMVMAIAADVVDLRTTRPVAGITTGAQTLDDLGTNLALGGLVGALIMVIGGVLACFGLRWGAGLAGGAGLAVLGWAALTIGLAELPIAIAESITRTSSEEFTLRVTRDLGWWLVAGVGVLGLLVFMASLRSIGAGGRIALNPLIAALTAVAATVVAFGPLVPVGGASFADNFRSVDPSRDLPTAFFAGRLGQVALIAVAGIVGMLLVRNYGVGLAAGGLGVATWMWATSIGEVGDRPIGIADRNPGADDTVPHAVTTTGVVSALVLLALATVLAIIRNRRQPTA